jgi:hypothetical protein
LRGADRGPLTITALRFPVGCRLGAEGFLVETPFALPEVLVEVGMDRSQLPI